MLTQKIKKQSIIFKIILVLLATSILLLAVIGCSQSDTDTKTDIVIYDGQFSEMKIIHRMVKYLVEDKTDLTVDIRDEMSPINTYRELVKGNCDLMNSYDGTLLTTYLGMDTSDVPQGESLYDFANEIALEKDQVRLLAQLGTDNTYAIAVPESIAQEYDLATVSDLVPVAGDLVFGAEHEFFSEEGSMKYTPFIEFYGLEFQDSVPVDLSLKYSAIENNMFDVTEVYATDGLNKKAGLVILEDDRSYFPEYNGALLVRNSLFEEVADTEPNLEDILNELSSTMNNEMMTDMTYAVDIDEISPEDVALKFLEDNNLID